MAPKVFSRCFHEIGKQRKVENRRNQSTIPNISVDTHTTSACELSDEQYALLVTFDSHAKAQLLSVRTQL